MFALYSICVRTVYTLLCQSSGGKPPREGCKQPQATSRVKRAQDLMLVSAFYQIKRVAEGSCLDAENLNSQRKSFFSHGKPTALHRGSLPQKTITQARDRFFSSVLLRSKRQTFSRLRKTSTRAPRLLRMTQNSRVVRTFLLASPRSSSGKLTLASLRRV